MTYIQVTTTTETKSAAQEIASAVVKAHLAACAQVVGPITSTYWWQGQVETAEEWLCVIKSREDLYHKLEKAIAETHSYQVPEILATPVKAGSRSYLDWLGENLQD